MTVPMQQPTPLIDAWWKKYGNGPRFIQANRSLIDQAVDQLDGITADNASDLTRETYASTIADTALMAQLAEYAASPDPQPVVVEVPATATQPAQIVPTGVTLTPEAHAAAAVAIQAAPPVPESHHNWFYTLAAMFGHGALAVAHSQIAADVVTVELQNLAAKATPSKAA